MTIWKILGLIFSLLIALSIASLVFIEIRIWLRDRRDLLSRRAAARRLFRRLLGAALLIAILVLLRFPAADSLSPARHLLKMLVCLGLCAAVVIVVIWDFRIVRRDMQREVEGFVEKSAQDLRQYLKEVSAKRSDDSS